MKKSLMSCLLIFGFMSHAAFAIDDGIYELKNAVTPDDNNSLCNFDGYATVEVHGNQIILEIKELTNALPSSSTETAESCTASQGSILEDLTEVMDCNGLTCTAEALPNSDGSCQADTLILENTGFVYNEGSTGYQYHFTNANKVN